MANQPVYDWSMCVAGCALPRIPNPLPLFPLTHLALPSLVPSKPTSPVRSRIQSHLLMDFITSTLHASYSCWCNPGLMMRLSPDVAASPPLQARCITATPSTHPQGAVIRWACRTPVAGVRCHQRGSTRLGVSPSVPWRLAPTCARDPLPR